ncbi:uncharacterized protein LOC126618468 [Malus sylvestris]|uniref:uncharacterized protein LOC126618468 n=1 Tax=Malus sylvestris TaxID=3752 RepID=UPI0021AB9D13|nr:uncharacterized protein LOC126618468 [Malus sylvestris]
MQRLSFSNALTSPTPLFLHTELSHLSLQSLTLTPKPMIIRMGGGPRTFPGGVSKWQWKRMQAKKAKQLLKARLCRERQIYEMRKRAELKAAVSELERPWEVVEKAPNLFSVNADEQVKVLADRFQKPGGFDLWTERDGPQLFHTMEDLPSARFFPKGVVHSVRPYKRISGPEELESLELEDGGFGGAEELGDGFKGKGKLGSGSFDSEESDGEGLNLKHALESLSVNGQSGKKYDGRVVERGNRRNSKSSVGFDNAEAGFDRKQRGPSPTMRGAEAGSDRKRRGQSPTRKTRSSKRNDSGSEVFDMSLQQDGSYELREHNGKP